MLFSKGKEFFDLIDRVAQNVLESAKALENFVAHSPTEAQLRTLEDLEHKGDQLTHDTIQLLNQTFITPLDREDIHALVSSMDDILDYIYGSANRMILYKITNVSEEFKVLARILVRTAEEVAKAALRLRDLKHPQMILAQCIEINRLENEADDAHRLAVATLFDREKDPINIIKIKEILDHMETATDRCEDVANVLESIVLKNA
ncbi:MAG: DUF47 family protein [Deltaproteobacteria bacterium]|nr:DUF47 family protein [Deltaproteobacteria bacterium]